MYFIDLVGVNKEDDGIYNGNKKCTEPDQAVSKAPAFFYPFACKTIDSAVHVKID